jgi:hypothetical protein
MKCLIQNFACQVNAGKIFDLTKTDIYMYCYCDCKDVFMLVRTTGSVRTVRFEFSTN